MTYQVWVLIDPIDVTEFEVRLFHTKNKYYKFGEPAYMNRNGFAQRRKTNNPLGWVITTGQNLNIVEHHQLSRVLLELIQQDIINGTNILKL